MFNGVQLKEPPCDDIVILSRSQPIGAIKFGSLSRRGSKNSSNSNIDIQSKVALTLEMMEADTVAAVKPIAQADSGTFSREDSCERLSSFSDSAENSSTTHTKSGLVVPPASYYLHTRLIFTFKKFEEEIWQITVVTSWQSNGHFIQNLIKSL